MMNTRTWKKAGIVTAILVLVLVVIGIAAPRLLDLNRYHGLIVSEVQKASGGQVTLGHISWGFTHRLWLEVDGFSIANASAFAGDVELTRLMQHLDTALAEERWMPMPASRYRAC